MRDADTPHRELDAGAAASGAGLNLQAAQPGDWHGGFAPAAEVARQSPETRPAPARLSNTAVPIDLAKASAVVGRRLGSTPVEQIDLQLQSGLLVGHRDDLPAQPVPGSVVDPHEAAQPGQVGVDLRSVQQQRVAGGHRLDLAVDLAHIQLAAQDLADELRLAFEALPSPYFRRRQVMASVSAEAARSAIRVDCILAG